MNSVSRRLRVQRLLPLTLALACCLAAPFVAAGEPTPDDLAARRERIEKMPLEEKKKLLEKLEQFTGLDWTEQDRLRKLHEALEKDAHAAQLAETLRLYYKFLNGLNAAERANLLAMDPAARIEKIAKIQKDKQLREQQREPGRDYYHPSHDDLKAIAAWLGEQIENKLSPDSPVRVFLADRSPEQRRGLLIVMSSMRFKAKADGNPGGPDQRGELLPRIDYSDPGVVADLKKRLSKGAQDWLAARGKPNEPPFPLERFLIPLARFHANNKFTSELLTEVSDDELVRFFQSLDDDKRGRLMDMGQEFRQERIKLMYLWEHQDKYLPPVPPNVEPDFFSRGGRGGPSRGGISGPPGPGGGRPGFGGPPPGSQGGFGGPGLGGERRPLNQDDPPTLKPQ